MFDSALSAVISVDTDSQTIHFYADVPGNTPSHLAAKYNSRPFNDDFFEKLDSILKGYRQKNPSISLAKVSLVLPDHVFFMDTVNVPALGKKAIENSLNLALGATYKNKNELKIHTYPVSQNKQTATFGVVGVRKDLLDRLNGVCEANHVGVQNITFASNAMVNGAFALNGKLKNGTFLLLDIQEDTASFAFVNKGKTVGSYNLPFGYAMLQKNRLASEDLLFDHAGGELLVLNAKERAKAKRLTMMGEEVLTDNDEQELLNADQHDGPQESEPPVDSKRSGRKLPKYMLRDMPTDPEGFVLENFRIFMKWALVLIAGNPDITAQGAIDTVYVNLPRAFHFLYDMVNKEMDENKVKFAPLLTGASFNMPTACARDLELFGGFYVRQYNRINNF